MSRCQGTAAATLKARSAQKHSGLPLTLPGPQLRGLTLGALPFPAAPRLTSLDTNSSLLQDQPGVLFTYWGKWWREWEFSPPLRKRVGVSDGCIHMEFKVKVCGGEDVPPSAWADTEPRIST